MWGIGNKVTTNLFIRAENNKKTLTHDFAMVYCFDLPIKAGLRAFIWYTIKQANSRTVDLFRVESEHPCFVPTTKQTHNKDDVKIVTCMATVLLTLLSTFAIKST